MFMRSIIIILLCFTTLILRSQTVLGMWKTVDDRDGVEKSYVEVYESDGKVYGKVTKLLKEPADKVCDKCNGERKDKPLMGMVVIEGLSKIKDYYGNGRIYDPVSGNDYGCSIWLEKINPMNSEYGASIGQEIYRTQTWYLGNVNNYSLLLS